MVYLKNKFFLLVILYLNIKNVGLYKKFIEVCYSYRCWKYLNSTSLSNQLKHCVYLEHLKKISGWYHAFCIWLLSSRYFAIKLLFLRCCLISHLFLHELLLCQIDPLQVLVQYSQYRIRDHWKWHQENIWTWRYLYLIYD